MTRRTREDGQSIVELALLMPILVLVTLCAVDLSLAVSQYIEVVNAASSAAQYASTSPAQASDTAAVHDAACSGLDGLSCAGIVSAYRADDGRGEAMGRVSVSVAVPFHPLGPFLSGMGFTIAHTAVMRVGPSQ